MTDDPPCSPLGFEEAATPFDSPSQRARVWTEGWVASHLFCAYCGEPHVSQYVANKSVADFHCPACGEDYELKSQKGRFGARVVDGAFRTINAVTPRLVLGVQATAQLRSGRPANPGAWLGLQGQALE